MHRRADNELDALRHDTKKAVLEHYKDNGYALSEKFPYDFIGKSKVSNDLEMDPDLPPLPFTGKGPVNSRPKGGDKRKRPLDSRSSSHRRNSKKYAGTSDWGKDWYYDSQGASQWSVPSWGNKNEQTWNGAAAQGHW